MVELLTLWRNTRMVALTALCAALFAAVLIPFKVLPIIPGITEARPANALPIVFSLLFGPAAAWGSAFGNTIGDMFGGTFGIGTLFGFVGNLFYGYLPYRLWGILGGREPTTGTFRLWDWARFLTVVFTSSLACALLISWPVGFLNLAPLEIVGPIILANNFVMALIIAPPLLHWVFPRVKRLGLLHSQVLESEERSRPLAGRIGLGLLLFGLVMGFELGALFYYGMTPNWASSPYSASAPFLLLALIGLFLI